MPAKNFIHQFGPWALITAASTALGKSYARALARKGLNIVLSSRNENDLTTFATDLEQEFQVSTRIVLADLCEPDAADVLYVRCADLDIGLLVSAANSTDVQHYLKSSLIELRKSIQLNVTAHTDLAHYFGEQMLTRRNGRGGILFMSSILGLQGTPYLSSFSASSGFLINFAEALHYENQKKGLHVTAVASGPTVSSSLNTSVPARALFKEYDLSVLEPDVMVDGALRALEKNKVLYIPGRGMHVRYGFFQRYFHSRSANVNLWGEIVKRYTRQFTSADSQLRSVK